MRLPASAVTAELLARLRGILSEHAGLRVQVVVTRRDAPVGRDVDVALYVGELPDLSGVVARRVRTFPWVMAAAPDYEAARGLPEEPAALSAHDCVRYRAAEAEERWVLDHDDGRRVTVPVGGVFESDDGRVLADATYAGMGIGVLPQREVRGGVEQGRLVEVLPGWAFAPPRVFLVGPRGRMRLPAVRTVARAVERVLAEEAEVPPG